MDEVELPEHARDSRTGLRRLAPEIEAARDKIIDHFEDKPFAELKEFVQQLLENEEDEAKRLGALAARVYILRKRIIDFEETVELVPPDEPSAELNVADDETTGRNWARVRVLENCEVNGMRLPEGIIVDVSVADAQRLIDAGHAEMREAADSELSEEKAISEEQAMSEEDETPDASKPLDTNEDINEETGEDNEAKVAAEPEAEEALEAEEAPEAKDAPEADDDADNEPDAEPDEGDLVTDEAEAELDETDAAEAELGEADEPDESGEPDEEPLAVAEELNDTPQTDDEAGANADTRTDVEPDAELLDTGDHALATAIAETAEAFNEIDVALAADSAEEQAASKNENSENNENDENEGANET